jgi:hypothetical protein
MTQITENMIGSSIMVVDVFVIHMLSKAQTSMKPPISRLPSVPTRARIASVIRRWRFHFYSASAMMNPPKNR